MRRVEGDSLRELNAQRCRPVRWDYACLRTLGFAGGLNDRPIPNRTAPLAAVARLFPSFSNEGGVS